MAFKSTLGVQISRAAAADPQNVWQTIFTVAGGHVLITGIVGIRTVVQAGGASTMQLRHSVGPVVLDAGTLSVAGDGVGCAYYLTGDPADPVVKADLFGAIFLGRIIASATRHSGEKGLIICGTGNIQVTMTAGAGTGSTGYNLWYIPITTGATVIAA